MSTLLIQTKLNLPPARRGQVARPQLWLQLDGLLEPGMKLALVAAPAGFGKTTLVADWIAARGVAAAWLALDADDNDLVHFWDYVVAALRRIAPGAGEQMLTLLHEPNPLPMPTLLGLLVNDLTGLDAPAVLVLDDYHAVQTDAVHQALTYFIEHLPPALRLILATRSDPPLPLARLRVRDQLLELRAANLRFDDVEAATFLAQMTRQDFTAGEVATLAERTEGWVAGLQLAALALRGRPDKAAFVHSFAGDHRYLLDYLVDEVLAGQPAPVQHFLIETSILARLSAPLCAAVTGHAHAQAVLEQLERDNLFVVALDERRQWYRYHQLFGDFLRHRLGQQDPTRLPALHAAASAWFEQHGFLLEAVSHALAGQDFDAAARLIEQTAELLLWRRPELHTLQGWLAALPEERLTARPRLCLYAAWTAYLTNQMGAAEQRVRLAETALAQGTGRADPLVAGMLATVQSTLTGIRQRFAESLPLAQAALAQLPPDAISWRCVAALNLGIAEAAIGRLDAATSYLTLAVELSQEIGSAFALLSAFWHLAGQQAAQLQLRAAVQTCRHLLQVIQDPDLQRFPVEGYVGLLLGEIFLERNELDAAATELDAAAAAINPEGFPMALLRCYVALARLYRVRRDVDAERREVARAEAFVAGHHLTGRASPLEFYQVRVWLDQGNLAAAATWVTEQGLGLDDDFGYHREPADLLLARLLLARARQEPAGPHAGQALHLLRRLAQRGADSGRWGSVARARTLEALALAACGQAAAALDALRHALVLVEAEGCVRLFADEGPALAPLLKALAAAPADGHDARAPAPAYVVMLLAALGETPLLRTPALPANRGLVEPLSERELEVLRLLAEDLSSNAIADRLIIAVETARKHIKNVYGKLDVHSRSEAVRRARELDLL